MKNEFDCKTRFLFSDNYSCWSCGVNRWDCLHHIVKRGFKNSDLESSPLNAAPLCNMKCHIGKPVSILRKKFLNLTYNYLKQIHYKLTEKDLKFIEKYKKYYV